MNAVQVLQYKTPTLWAEQVLDDPLALLSDHAYLERKAASNVLELFNRWPDPPRPGTVSPETWASTLAGIAHDETGHLDLVLGLLKKRGGRLQRLHKNAYANDLRTLVRAGRGKQELLDRLLVSALIEARSCERFVVLARVCEDRELAAFYKGLSASEAGHYAVFVELAQGFLPASEVKTRWQQMVKAESDIIQSQPPGPRIHSSVRMTPR